LCVSFGLFSPHGKNFSGSFNWTKRDISQTGILSQSFAPTLLQFLWRFCFSTAWDSQYLERNVPTVAILLCAEAGSIVTALLQNLPSQKKPCGFAGIKDSQDSF
jgi:hypothetical protein